MIPRRVLAAGLAVAALVPAACSDDGPGEGEARLEVDGQAIVERSDGERDVINGSTDLHKGDRVEITKGVGRLLLRRGTRMELRAALGTASNSTLMMGTTPELEAGDLLVSAPETLPLSAGGSTLTIDRGAARVSRALGVGVAAYDADVHVDSAGVEREVPALRQMQVPALGQPPHAPRPLVYDAEDAWDRRFLGQAIELGERLKALAKGYTDNLDDGEGRTPGFFRLVLPGLEDEPELDELLDVERAPGETLVGAAIAELGRHESFGKRWTSVFAFRDQGAEWGLVALDQEVSGTPLLGSIEDAVGSSPLAFVEPTVAGGSAAPGSTVAPPAGAAGPPATTPPAPPTPSPPPTAPPPTAPPVPTEPLTPVLEPPVEPITKMVSDLVGGLLGILG